MAQEGRLLHSGGDPDTIAFLRSSAKPFQVLPFVEKGGLAYFDISDAELSLACASHDGFPLHLNAVRAMQAKIGVSESDLQCGGHAPDCKESAIDLVKRDCSPSNNYNNCSGKHTAMLACAKMQNLPIATYLDRAHPIQRDIRSVLTSLCDFALPDSALGVDGCSAPTFALPLRNTALGLARLCDPPPSLGDTRRAACAKISGAMMAYPDMVHGPGGFDSELMRVGQGRILSKRGAEGLQVIGLLPGVAGEKGVGIALKVTDGDSAYRVRPAVTVQLLQKLGALDASQCARLAKFGPELTLRNWRGIPTGPARAVARL